MNTRDLEMENNENDYINQRDKNYLFVVGIDKYNKQFAKELENAENDAKDIKKVLEDEYSFKCLNALYNDKATRKNIINALNNIPARIGKTVDYNLVIYFAGHGKVINKRGVLIPVDYDGEHDSYISYDDLLGIIRNLGIRHLLLIFDCCFAGSIFEKYRSDEIPKIEEKNSRWGLVSSMRDERASDGKSGEQNSPFTATILKYLKTPPISNTFTIHDLVSYTISQKLEGQNSEAGVLANCGDDNGCFRLYHKDYKPSSRIFPLSYIDDTNIIKFIIESTTITSHSKRIILEYIKNNNDYEQFFWKELSNPEWFPVLKSESFFDVHKYPKPILQENGELNHPFWFVLIYMKRMAEQRKKPELIQEVANFILEISNYSTENARINEYFIGLFGCFPKEFISLELLDFLPKWCDNSLYFSLNLITEGILPKFFDTTENENAAKIEKILSFILGLQKVKQVPQTFLFASTVVNTEEKEVYKPIYENDFYYIKRLFLNYKDKIANNISDKFIFELAQNVKKLLLEKVEPTYYDNFKINESVFQLAIRISENILFYSLLADKEVVIEEKEITDYENMEAIAIVSEIQSSFKQLSIEDHFSILLTTFIEKMQLGYYWINEDNVFEQQPNGYNSQEMYIWILKEILIHREEKIEILRSFYNSPKFSFKIFKQLLLHIIVQDWQIYSFLFWELIGEEDKYNIFSNYVYEKHLHKLLSANALNFNNEQCALLDHIIDTSREKLKREEEGYQSYWQLKMYSVLRANPYFEAKYENLSKELNKNIEESISPIQQEDNSFALTIRELSQKTNQDIANYVINSAQNITPYELNRVLRELVSLQTQKFLTDFEVFLTLPDTHIITILASLKNAWLEGKDIGWQQIISFIQLYISKKREDNSYREIISILDVYLTDKSERFDNTFLLPIKQILLEVKKYLEIEKVDKSYSIHNILSTSYGNWAFILLNYALKYAKITYQEKSNEVIKWEEDIREAFDNLMAADIPEIHIQIGLCFGNFYYLDKDWLWAKIEMYKDCDNEKIQEYFIRGFFDGGANPWREGYSLLLPLYKKAIINKWYKNQNLATHIVSFFFWNIDKLEDENSLINTYLSHANEDSLGNLISELSANSTISYKVRYVKKEEQENFEMNILQLFKTINKKIFELGLTNSRSVASYFLLLKYFQQFNDDIVEFVCDLLKIENEPYLAGLYEGLFPFIKGDNDTFANAQNIEKILSCVTPSDYIGTKEQANLLQLFQFMYKYKSLNEGFKPKFDALCSKFVKKGYSFLRNLYD